MATVTIEGRDWAEKLKNELAGLRVQLRQIAARIQTLSGKVNALAPGDKTKITDALSAMGMSIVELKAELTGMNTIATSIMSAIQDLPDVLR